MLARNVTNASPLLANNSLPALVFVVLTYLHVDRYLIPFALTSFRVNIIAKKEQLGEKVETDT